MLHPHSRSKHTPAAHTAHRQPRALLAQGHSLLRVPAQLEGNIGEKCQGWRPSLGAALHRPPDTRTLGETCLQGLGNSEPLFFTGSQHGPAGFSSSCPRANLVENIPLISGPSFLVSLPKPLLVFPWGYLPSKLLGLNNVSLSEETFTL